VIYLAYALMWTATAAAVCFGIHETGSLHALLGFTFPAMVSFRSKSCDCEDES
jgi:hypothetical protein